MEQHSTKGLIDATIYKIVKLMVFWSSPPFLLESLNGLVILILCDKRKCWQEGKREGKNCMSEN